MGNEYLIRFTLSLSLCDSGLGGATSSCTIGSQVWQLARGNPCQQGRLPLADTESVCDGGDDIGRSPFFSRSTNASAVGNKLPCGDSNVHAIGLGLRTRTRL